MSITINANIDNIRPLSKIQGVVCIKTVKDEPQYCGFIVQLLGRERTQLTVHHGESSTTYNQTETFLSNALSLKVANIQVDSHKVR